MPFLKLSQVCVGPTLAECHGICAVAAWEDNRHVISIHRRASSVQARRLGLELLTDYWRFVRCENKCVKLKLQDKQVSSGHARYMDRG